MLLKNLVNLGNILKLLSDLTMRLSHKTTEMWSQSCFYFYIFSCLRPYRSRLYQITCGDGSFNCLAMTLRLPMQRPLTKWRSLNSDSLGNSLTTSESLENHWHRSFSASGDSLVIPSVINLIKQLKQAIYCYYWFLIGEEISIESCVFL